MFFDNDRVDALGKDAAVSLTRKLSKENRMFDSIPLSISDYFSDYNSKRIKKAMYELKKGNAPFLYVATDRLQKDGKTLLEYWIDYYSFVYKNASFPFGHKTLKFERHKKKMLRRYEDVKNKSLIPPNFNSVTTIGLNDMKNYIDNRSFYSRTPKPKVKGKTLILPMFKFEVNNSMKLNDWIIFTYINKFDNVEIPAKYLIKHDYKDEDSLYQINSIYSMLYDFNRNGLNGYKRATEYFSKFQVICFNLFLAPMRDKHLEDFMSYLLAFQLGHPDIYIKDISGRGYNVYRKFSFYDELLNSRIDVSVA